MCNTSPSAIESTSMKALSVIRWNNLQFIIFLPAAIFMLLFFGCGKSDVDGESEAHMAALLLSRSNIVGVQSYKDDYYMHGLNYFYFHATSDDIDRLVGWLGLKKHSGIPQKFSKLFKTASMKTGWEFVWETSAVYLTYYCHPSDGTTSSVDMLLVGDGDAIYITSGFLATNSFKTDDTSSCAPAQLK